MSASGRQLQVHASDDGRVLESGRTCSIAGNGLALRSETKGVIVCDSGELRSVAFPGLAQEVVGSTGQRVEIAGWSDALVATGNRDGKVAVFDIGTWKQLDNFTLDDEIKGLAVSPDGRYVGVGVGRTGLRLRDLQQGSTKKLAEGDYRASAIGFSADGRRLFSKGDGFTAQVIEVEGGKIVETHATGSWLTSSRWLGKTLVAATGSEGFVLYASGEPPKKLIDPSVRKGRSLEALGVSADGQIVCGGDRDGRISCFSTKPMPASSYTPAPKVAETDPRPPGPGAAAGPQSSVLLEGVIASRKKKVVSVTARSPNPPAVGTRGDLSRSFERQLGRMKLAGWMQIAEVEVIAVTGDTVKLRILKESANVRVNGRKQNQFRKGFVVKLETASD